MPPQPQLRPHTTYYTDTRHREVPLDNAALPLPFGIVARTSGSSNPTTSSDEVVQGQECSACAPFCANDNVGDAGMSVSLNVIREAAVQGCNVCQALFNGIVRLLQLQQKAWDKSKKVTEKGWAEKWLMGLGSEFILHYGPKYEHPFYLAGWSLRCTCNRGGRCQHGADRFRFDIFSLKGKNPMRSFSRSV